MGDIVIAEGNNELNIAMASLLPSIEILNFHYVYQGLYTWDLTDRMIHGQDITHIGFRFRNNEATPIDNVSLKFRVIDGGQRELSPPRDQWGATIPEPFSVPPGETLVWYLSGPSQWGKPDHCRAEAEVWVGNQLAASATLEFSIEYDLPSIGISDFIYGVFPFDSLWRMHNEKPQPIILEFINNEDVSIDKVTVRMIVVGMETLEGVARPDEELPGLPTDPFTISTGFTQVAFIFNPVTDVHVTRGTVIGQVYVEGRLAASASRQFDVVY